ncbi:polysaccharide biosynthesis protein [Peribacillus asahii]|uniref:Polysaccharide biosynthesis protein n=1 Tax=Peribacillus asahii TaxID=228899 RepID=A0A3Q9RR41_9BACI|nr:oligosaccharide flippase family protein [Peribacillus asahii]AZV45335.1 polysaccharide biosynthesis protein [Peribacillus asahii]
MRGNFKKIYVNNQKKFSKFSWLFFGNVIYALSQYVLLITIAKLGQIEMVGQYGLALALTAPLLMFSNMNLRSIWISERKMKFDDFVGSRIIINSSLLGFFLILVFFLDYNEKTKTIILLVFCLKIIESFSDIYYAQLQKQQMLESIGKSLILKSIISVALFSLSMIVWGNLILALLIQIFGFIVLFYIYEYRIVNINLNFKLFLKKKNFKLIIVKGFPLGVAGLLISLNVNIPRFFIEKFLDISLLGYFIAISYLLQSLNTFIASLSQFFLPLLSRKYDEDLSIFKDICWKIIIFMVGFSIIMISIFWFLGEEILLVVYDKSYMDYKNILILLSIAFSFNFLSTMLETILNSMRKYVIQSKNVFISFVCVTIFSLFLLPSLGLEGAAYAIIISAVLRMSVNFVVFVRTIKLSNI